MIVDPIGADMLAVASSDTPEVLVATVDLDNVAAAQTSLPWWRDRRPGALRVAVRRLTGWPAIDISRQTYVQWLAILAAMVIDSTVLIAAVLVGVIALLVFFPFDKL